MSKGKVQPQQDHFHGIMEQSQNGIADPAIHTPNCGSAHQPVESPAHSTVKVSPTDRYHPVDDEFGEVVWPREIGLGMKVENILSVDSANSKFTATVKLSYEWQLTEEEHLSFKAHTSNAVWRPSWEPRFDYPSVEKIELKEELMIPNMKSSSQQKLYDTFEHQGKVYTILYLRIRAVFSEVY